MAIRTRNNIRPFQPAQLEKISQILGVTIGGLTGSEIGHKLAQCKIPDSDPTNTKWKRLYNAFAEFQNKHKIGNHVIVFINEVMNPASYTDCPELFNERKDQLNTVLALSGFFIETDGKIKKSKKAKTLDEALERSNRMKELLRRRNAHKEVIRFCNSEIIANNNFHAVLEAMKSITSRIRTISGLSNDGAVLVQDAFSSGPSGQPLLAINELNTKTKMGEQNGFVNVLIGLYGMIRNPTAHEPKIEWPMNEQDALDILTTISFIHRKLDKTYKYNGK